MKYIRCINCFAALAGDGICPRCGFDCDAYTPEQHHLLPGMVLRERYLLGRAMGEGGFGITYAAFDGVLDRKVAVKEFFPAGTVWRETSQTTVENCYTSQNLHDRFSVGITKCLQEAKSLARLDDIPSIVRVLDFFRENNTAYIIMEFVEGVTLRQYLMKQPKRLTFCQSVELLSPIGKALEKVHGRGFVHRDVSPDNIMIANDGSPKLLDFGAVKTVTSEGNSTENPVVKRGFSPSEMYSTVGKIGTWSDVYAYCATLYYMIAGMALDEPMNRLNDDRVPASLERLVSPSQKEVLLWGLTIQPKDRCQTMAELNAALEACKNEPNPQPSAPSENAASTILISPSAEDKTAPIKTAAEEKSAVPAQPDTKEAPDQGIMPALPETPAGTELIPQATDAGLQRVGAATELIPGTPADVVPVGEKPVDPIIIDGGINGTKPRKKKHGCLFMLIGGVVALALATAIILLLYFSPDEEQTLSEGAVYFGSGKIGTEVGDVCLFGHYEQDNDAENGKEPIEWLILKKEEDRALLISRKALDCRPYHQEPRKAVTWETCSLRGWLNGAFFEDAFSAKEQKKILSTTVAADPNPYYDTDPGNDTTDKVFLLAFNEREIVFYDINSQKCEPTATAKANGVWTDKYGNCQWWLRTPGNDPDQVALIGEEGYGYGGGWSASDPEIAVRPVLWISMEGNATDDPETTVPDTENTVYFGKGVEGTDVGYIYRFGTYEQDNDTANGPEDIEWLIVKKDGNRALLLSKDALDCRPYHTGQSDVTWETCELRSWLNGTFYNTAFSADEQKRIQTVTVTADKNTEYTTSQGKDTEDKIFLLSEKETLAYLNSDYARKCAATQYAIAQGAYQNNDSGCCWWWLRTAGAENNSVILIFHLGFVLNDGSEVDHSRIAVRPAMWIELDQ